MGAEFTIGLTTGFGLGVAIAIFWLQKGTKSQASSLLNPVKLKNALRLNHKLVLVVRNDLQMGKGKIAAQCSHASIMAATKSQETDLINYHPWIMTGQRKVVVKVENESSLNKVKEAADEMGLTTSLIQDGGHTQVAPGTVTVLGVGPGPSHLLDEVTGHLKLM